MFLQRTSLVLRRSAVPRAAFTRAFSEGYPKKPMEGQQVPDVTFKTRVNNEFVDVNTRSHFAGKKVVLFALPGAFTPTCSSTHLPGYAEKAAELKAQGVDEIACLSVNDGFVMKSWGEDLGVKESDVTLLPDGNGEFTKAMGMDCDKSAIGFGDRSWRYSMVIDNNEIKKIFAEPKKDGDPFEVSDVDTMLAYLKLHK